MSSDKTLQKKSRSLVTAKLLGIQGAVESVAAAQERRADQDIRHKHPLCGVPSVLRRPQHADEENHQERDAESGANPPFGHSQDDLENLAPRSTEAPPLPIVQYGERAAEVARQQAQPVRLEPEAEPDGVHDEDGGGGEPDEDAEEVEQQVRPHQVRVGRRLAVGDLLEGGLHAEEGGGERQRQVQGGEDRQDLNRLRFADRMPLRQVIQLAPQSLEGPLGVFAALLAQRFQLLHALLTVFAAGLLDARGVAGLESCHDVSNRIHQVVDAP